MRLRLIQRFFGFVIKVFSLKNVKFLVDQTKVSSEGLGHKFFQPRFLSSYGENSFTNLAPKILNIQVMIQLHHISSQPIYQSLEILTINQKSQLEVFWNSVKSITLAPYRLLAINFSFFCLSSYYIFPTWLPNFLCSIEDGLTEEI